MLNYNAPAEGSKSSIDGAGSDQMNTFFWLKKAIIESRKEQYFMQLAPTINMPKNMGKTIKVYEYVPLLDDRNINDQGIDANGVTIVPETYAAYNAAGAFVSRNHANQAAALAAAGAGGSAYKEGGNLYGSSRDIGTITTKLPVLAEGGGRVNRVGFTRLQREGSIFKFGFFTEFTQDSLDFDSDADLMNHLSRELMNGAVQLTEAVLQKDLLANAGTILFAGVAMDDDEITGEGADISLVSYDNFMRLDQILNDNRTPKHTTVITGSRLVDTKTLPAARVMYIGTELVPHVKKLKDPFNNQAFIPVQQYGDAGTILTGEIGTVDSFRLVLVPEMLHWAGAGAAVAANPGYRSTQKGGAEHYDIYPMLVVGDDSFATIGFQTDGKTVKFSVLTKMPGRETADRNDPFGETGFSSMKWWYGFLSKRPERIGLIKTVAPR